MSQNKEDIGQIEMKTFNKKRKTQKPIVLRPKWAAGDRIYLPKEKEYATIKWIGSRHYRFSVAIEYDKPLGDDKFDSEDLPFLIKQGYGRQLPMEQLNATAEKVNPTSPRVVLNNIIKWTSGSSSVRNQIPQNSMFYVERPTTGSGSGN